MSDDFELFDDTPAPAASAPAPASSSDLFFDDDADDSGAAAPAGMSMKERVAQYVELFAVDAESQALIRGNSQEIMRATEQLVTGASDWVTRFPPFGEKLAGDAGTTLKGVLVEHWRHLYSCEFTADYIATAQQLGFMLAYLDLGASWYQAMASAGAARALSMLKGNRRFEALSQALGKVAQMDVSLVTHDYFEAAKQARAKTVTDLASGFERSIKGVVDEVGAMAATLKSHSDEMLSRLSHMDYETVNMAAAAEEAAFSVDNISQNTSDLANSIEHIRVNVVRTADAAEQAAQAAQATDEAMRGLLDVASRIGKIGETIDTIARQTRMLALNATIEAARAGDKGRGFSVVASEVKALAEQTARATAQVTDEITNIQNASRGTSKAVELIAETIRNMNLLAREVADAAVGQGHASRDISVSMDEAAGGSRTVSASIGGVQDAVASNGDHVSEVQTLAGRLAERAQLLGRSVETFLSCVRAA